MHGPGFVSPAKSPKNRAHGARTHREEGQPEGAELVGGEGGEEAVADDGVDDGAQHDDGPAFLMIIFYNYFITIFYSEPYIFYSIILSIRVIDGPVLHDYIFHDYILYDYILSRGR